MRNLLLTLHRWSGLTLGIIIFIVAVTGSSLVFENDIDSALNANVVFAKGTAMEAISLQAAANAVRLAYPNDPPVSVRVIPLGFFTDNRSIEFSLKSGLAAYVEPSTGQVLGARSREGFARFLHLLHTRLVAGETGEYVVGAITFVTFLMSLSGLYLWWPRKVLALKKSPYWRRTNLDLHHVLGFYSAFVMIVITLSGVVIAFEKYTEPMLAGLDAHPAPAVAPPESTPIDGAMPISVDEAIRIANAALPGAQTTAINLATPGKAVYRALLKFPEDRTPAGRSRVHIDQWSGTVLQKTSTRDAGLGTSINNLKRSLHTGDILGWPTQLIYFLASLMIAGQVISGFLIWWKPGKFSRDASPDPSERA